ncbi:MAG TPA: hypothetical protein PJ986_06035 [Gammaproteobacteria bacterium]|nr:hypothetical protein [Gammaproteobacteria bacterium]
MFVARLFKDLGALRAILLACTLVLIALAPFADGKTYLHDARLLTSVVAPALMVIFVFVLMLDITMTRIFSIDTSPERRAGMRRAVRIECWLLLTLLAAWTPFALRLFEIWPVD